MFSCVFSRGVLRCLVSASCPGTGCNILDNVLLYDVSVTGHRAGWDLRFVTQDMRRETWELCLLFQWDRKRKRMENFSRKSWVLSPRLSGAPCGVLSWYLMWHPHGSVAMWKTFFLPKVLNKHKTSEIHKWIDVLSVLVVFTLGFCRLPNSVKNHRI